jgi:hypothetical protein
LSQDKKKIGFFLAAGCPYSIKIKNSKDEIIPLIPNIQGLTDSIGKNIEENAGKTKEDYDCIIKLIKENGNPSPNIEDLLSYVRTLREVIGIQSIGGLDSDSLQRVETIMCNNIVDIVKQDLPKNTSYHQLASWISSISREAPIEIFTTNYDLLVEQALESINLPYFDGFVGSYTPFFDNNSVENDELPPNWARLWKIHGSINWYTDKQYRVYRLNGNTNEKDFCRIIHPSHLKYEESRKMPYLSFFDRLKKFIRSPHSILIICGYSFNDEHINEAISNSLRYNPTSTVIALVYGEIENYTNAIKIASVIQNFSLIAFDQGIIGTKLGFWGEKKNIPDNDIINKIIIKDTENLQQENEYYSVSFEIGDFNKFTSLLHNLTDPYNSGILDENK